MAEAETKEAHELRCAKAVWERAVLAWSRDDGKDPEKTGSLGERLLYAATDLICAYDAALEVAAIQRAEA